MAERLIVRNYFTNSFGLVDPLRDAIVDGQGYNSWDSFLDIKVDDVDGICANIRKPGGTIPNPAVAGALIANPGVAIGH